MHKLTALVIGVSLSSSVLSADVTIRQSPIDSLIIDRPSTDRPKLPNTIPEKLPSFTLPPAEKILLPQTYKNAVKIQLKGIKFTGNTVISDDDLQKIAQPFIGKAVSVPELEELRQQISQYYVQQGYVNSGAVLPNQQFQDGIITLQIIEGKLTEIRVKGTEWLSPSYISERLYADDEQVLDTNQLRQNFQQLLLDPLIERMNGSLIPASKRGTSILEVDVTRARPYQLSLTADNYTPPSIGGEINHLSGWVRNLTGLGDIVSGSVAYSEGLLGGSGSFSIPLNAHNTRFNFHFDRNNATIVERTLKPLNITSRYANYEFGLSQPLIQTLNRNLNIGVVFNFKRNKTFLGILNEPFPFSEGASKDGVSKDSVLRFSLDFTERLEHQVFSARSTTSVGINALAPTWHNDPSNPDGNFVSWLGQAQYAGQVFDTDANLILRGDVQYSDDKLMTLERFALGGRYSVRGYRENELVRDKAYDLSAELRYPLIKDEGERNFSGQLTIFPFMDYGAGQNRGDSAHISYLYSIGIGLEWQAFKQVTTEIIYAHALKKATPKADYNLQDSGLEWRVNISAF
ncbi:MAG: BamA/TamA family outer membrane protein [Methylococcales bacterium]|nr:BamA/TamA family outer membrane protein [Methylococcales bacterium]